MAINTLDQFIAAAKQRMKIFKTASRTAVALMPFSVFDLTGDPGSGTLAGTSTTVPVMPTDATPGCPSINFSTGSGYITWLTATNTVACGMFLHDMLSKSGAYSYAAGTTTISTPLDISSRCPDLNGGYWGSENEIWIEVSTAFTTGTAWQVQVTYTNQSGTTGRSTVITAAAAASALTLGKMVQLALQSGDTGVQKIESVIVTNGGTAMTAGAFNVLILRPLIPDIRIPIANGLVTFDLMALGMPIIYSTSALRITVQADSTASGLPRFSFQIASA